MNIQTYYQYKIYNSSSVYLGMLKVVSPFEYNQNIGTAFTQIQVKLAQKTRDTLTVEDNLIKVYEFNKWHPAGIIVFDGYISKVKSSYGNDDSILLTCLSNGNDMNNYLVNGSPYVADQSQTSENSSAGVQVNSKSGGITGVGQTFQVGAGVTNVGAIDVMIGGIDPSVTLTLWPSVTAANSGTGALGSVTLATTSSSPVVVRFAFSSPIGVTAGNTYFFTIDENNGNNISVYYQNSNVYANGDMYRQNYGGGGGDANFHVTPYSDIANNSDLYFKTYSSAGATAAVFSSEDPTTILTSVISDYNSRGGAINTAAGSTDNTGLTLSYTFNDNIIMEAITACLSMAPADWYWYVDPATDILYFKEASASADIKLTLGREINVLEVESTKENIKNQAYFTGGDDGTGTNTNVFVKVIQSPGSNRIGLIRLSDLRVKGATGATVGMQIATNYLNANNSITYITTVMIQDAIVDTSQFKLGMIVGFKGGDSFVNGLLLQIVGRHKMEDQLELQLGTQPVRTSLALAKIEASLTSVLTAANPSTPS